MKLIYKKHITTVALIWAGCFILFVFFYMLVLAPQNKSIKRFENELVEKRNQYESALKASTEESRTQIEEQIAKLRDKLDDFVLDFEDSANLTFDLGQIATEGEIASFSIKSREKGVVSAIPNCDYIYEYYIDIGFIGQFNQLATFINTLERHRPVIFIDGFAIGQAGRQEHLGHRVNLNVSVFVRKQQDS